VATHDKQTRDNPPGPLSDLRVLDLSRVLAGPWCTQNLADMGADVIKIEQPGKGDMTRATPPKIDGESAGFMTINRNKRSVALDLKQPASVEILKKLAATSDVFLENYRPGALDAHGL
jgi:crotonobetainyl-CoA:carnitine CoA-transferase CaiB-like acyl-CoA transferase